MLIYYISWKDMLLFGGDIFKKRELEKVNNIFEHEEEDGL